VATLAPDFPETQRLYETHQGGTAGVHSCGDFRGGRGDALVEPADLGDQVFGEGHQGGQQRGLWAHRAQ
jgi:hypothetical protein